MTIGNNWVNQTVGVIRTFLEEGNTHGLSEGIRPTIERYRSQIKYEEINAVFNQAQECIESWGKNVDSAKMKRKECLVRQGLASALDGKTYFWAKEIITCDSIELRNKIEFMKIRARRDAYGTLMDLEYYGVKNLSVLQEIVKLAVNQGKHEDKSFWWVKYFGDKNEKILVEMMKKAAVEDTYWVCRLICYSGIKDQDALIEIGKIVAKNFSFIAEFISNFGIEDEQARIEIAKIVAKRFGAMISQYIHRFDISEEKERIAIALIAARQDGGEDSVSEYIDNYEIEDEDGLIRIAKCEVKTHPWSVSKYFHNYGIKNALARFEIAKIVAFENSCHFLYKHIGRFGIREEDRRVELAMIFANNKWGLPLYRLDKFRIENEEKRLEIVRIAIKNGSSLSGYLRIYSIEEKDVLREFIMLSARYDAFDVLRIAKDNESCFSECLMLAAQQAASSRDKMAWAIEKYEVHDQKILFKIAEIQAGCNREFSKYIGKYGIEAESDRIKLAMIAAHCKGSNISMHIKNYEIDDQEALIEIAMIAAKHEVEYGSKNQEGNDDGSA